MLSWVQHPPFVQGTMIRDVFDPTAIWDESLFCHHVLKFIRVDFGKSPLLRDVDLERDRNNWVMGPEARSRERGDQGCKETKLLTFWRPGNLNLARRRASITCSLFCSLVRMDIMTWPMWTLATVPWGFPKAPRIPVWSLDWETAGQSWMPTRKSCLQGPLGQPVQATGCIHYQGACYLQPLHTGPPWGKEHSQLNWL